MTKIVLVNRHVQFNITVFYHQWSIYYIAIGADVLCEYISANFDRVKDVYTGYYTRINRKWRRSTSPERWLPASSMIKSMRRGGVDYRLVRVSTRKNGNIIISITKLTTLQTYATHKY